MPSVKEAWPTIDSWGGRIMAALATLLLALSLWVQKNMFGELQTMNDRIHALEIGQTAIKIEIEGQNRNAAAIQDANIRIRELERQVWAIEQD